LVEKGRRQWLGETMGANLGLVAGVDYI